jgi:cell division protein FtsB
VLCLAAMKKTDPKEPVSMGVLDEAVEAILEGIELMFSKQGKRFDKLEAGQKDLQRQINDLKYDIPTQKEFDTLKSKVDKYHPLT